MGYGIIPCGAGSNGSQYCALGQIELSHFLVKISPCCHLDSKGIVAQVDGIEIIGDDLLLELCLIRIRLVLYHKGYVPLLELTFIEGNSVLISALEYIVLDKLLGDGGASARIIAGDDSPYSPHYGS